MVAEQDWHIFGPAAICRALGRPLPPVADVYFTGIRPTRRDIVDLLDAGETLQIRYTTTPPVPIVNMDDIQIAMRGKAVEVRDPHSVLLSKKVTILTHDISLVDAIRLRHMMALFAEFEWPAYLRRKVDSDQEYTQIAEAYDDDLRLAVMNLDHDFGANGDQPCN